MKKLVLLFGFLIPVFVFAQSNRIVPQTSLKKSPYKGCKNTGKSIGVLGGSLSVKPESNTAKQIWANLLGDTVVTYGVGGAGFSIKQGHSLQKQADEAGVHDIYVLWASTNDYMKNQPCGHWTDYTVKDGYDSTKLETQCGGINYCIKRLMEKNPRAEIYFFTPVRFFKKEAGYNPYSKEGNKTGLNFAEYIQAQRACCAHYGIPVLDMFNLQGVNEFNYQLYYLPDKLHMTQAGYRKIGYVQAAFLANGK